MPMISQFLQSIDGCIQHYCPACMELHTFHTLRPDNVTGAQWEWDGNIVDPTFSPNMMLRWYQAPSTRPTRICHYALKDGMLEFLADTTHQFRCLTVHLPAIPDFLRPSQDA